MSTWASLAAGEAARTSAAGGRILHFITPGALDGFAIGALLTGVCLLLVVAPRMQRNARLAARDGVWSGRKRHGRARPDYFAAPVDGAAFASAVPVHAAAFGSGVPVDSAAAVGSGVPVDSSAGFDGTSFGSAAPDPCGSDSAAPIASDQAAASSVGIAAAVHLYPRAQDSDPYRHAVGTDLSAAAGASATPVSTDSFSPGGNEPVAGGLADELTHQDDSRTGYRSKHRLAEPDRADRRPESRRTAPRHAAPSAGFSSWMSERFGVFALAARS